MLAKARFGDDGALVVGDSEIVRVLRMYLAMAETGAIDSVAIAALAPIGSSHFSFHSKQNLLTLIGAIEHLKVSALEALKPASKQ